MTLEEKYKGLSLNEYQQRAMTTCTESSNNFSYMMLNLVGEVGELASKVAKRIRKEHIAVNENILVNGNKCGELNGNDWGDLFNEMRAEAGDVLWQLSGLCTVMGWSLEDIAEQNLEKLASRKERNVIVGDGDNR